MNERDLVVYGPTFLSLTAWRHISETWLQNKAITGPKSRGTSLGMTVCMAPRPEVLRYISCFYANLVPLGINVSVQSFLELSAALVTGAQKGQSFHLTRVQDDGWPVLSHVTYSC